MRWRPPTAQGLLRSNRYSERTVLYPCPWYRVVRLGRCVFDACALLARQLTVGVRARSEGGDVCEVTKYLQGYTQHPPSPCAKQCADDRAGMRSFAKMLDCGR